MSSAAPFVAFQWLGRHLIGVTLAFVLLASIWAGRISWSNDVCVYTVASRAVSHGQTLYVDAWQDKPLLGLLPYALPDRILPGSTVGLQVFLVLVCGVQAAIAYLVLPGPKWSRAVACALLLLLPFAQADFVAPGTEHLSNVFVVALTCSTLRVVETSRYTGRNALLFGLLTACAFQTRQSAVLAGAIPLVALAVAPVSFATRARLVFAFVVGAAIGTAAICAFAVGVLGIDGALYFDTIIRYPRRYASVPPDYGTMVAFLRDFVVSPLAVVLVIPLLAIGRRPLAWGVYLSVFTMFAGCVIPLKSYPHYWVSLIPSAALAWWLFERRDPSPRESGSPMVAAILLFLVLCTSVTLARASSNDGFHRLDEVCSLIREAGPEASLFAAGEPSDYVYFRSGCRVSNPYFYGMQLDSYHNSILPRPIERIVESYIEKPPDVIAFNIGTRPPWYTMPTTTRIFEELRRRHRYELLGTRHDWQVWRLTQRIDGDGP